MSGAAPGAGEVAGSRQQAGPPDDLRIPSRGGARSYFGRHSATRFSAQSRAFLARSLSCSAAAGELVMSAGGVRRDSLSSRAMSGKCRRKVVLSRSGAANQTYSKHQGPQLSLLLPISWPTPVLLRICQPYQADRRHVIVIAGLAADSSQGRLLFRRAVTEMQMTNSGALTSAAGITRIRPSRLWYILAGILLAGAVACLGLAATSIFALDRQIQDFQRVPVPGQAQITFSNAGGYVLYIEGPGHCCSFNSGSAGQAPFAAWSMKVAIQPARGGPLVPISTWRGATDSYAVTGHQGQTAMYFTIHHPGTYLLGASDVKPGSIADLAVGRRIGTAGTIPIVLILAAILVLGPAGLIVGGVTAVRRTSHRNRRPHPWSGQPLPTPEPARAGWRPMPMPICPAPPAGDQAGPAAAISVRTAPDHRPRPAATMPLPAPMPPPAPMLPPAPM